MVQAGSIVDVQLTSSTGLSSPDGVIAQAVAILAQDGRLTVVQSSVINGSLSGMGLSTLLSLSPDQPFQADVQVSCNSAFAQPSDVASIVANAFYQVNSQYPSSVSAVSVTPSGGTLSATGSPALTSSNVGGSSAGGGVITAGISNFASSLGTLGTNLLIGLAAIVVLTLILIAYGPNVGKIASHV